MWYTDFMVRLCPLQESYQSIQLYIVLSPLVYTQSGLNPDCGMDCKKILDDVQMQKVQISDMVLVVDENGYIGPSTKKQLNYAKLLKKVIFFYSKGGHKKL